MPAWIAVLLIGREITVTGLRWVAASKGMVISANFGGKSKTAFQMIALILLIRCLAIVDRSVIQRA